MKYKSGLVLLSGGQDSTTCLAIAQNECETVYSVSFDYGQRHRIELQQAQKIASLANVDFHIIDATFINKLNNNALTDSSIEISQVDNEIPNTFVPGRNLFFLAMAAVYARERECNIIYTGVCETDYSGYPDCRSDFIKSAEQTINLAMESHFEIKTPLMTLSKAATVRLMYSFNKMDWYSHSHTCYEGKRPACGVCPACILRLKGFKDAGFEDPLSYEYVLK
ncbi:7-cyano-7-deazaguanine synthase QueC [Candidatus Marinamargulisbacteria bacterium SCGC AAA071-K20]|nr:7-cyano-7-deazaguanine synthase QueC [Candidatus Marinamargulisbacteria bacterium SCGC AAA071-K20]